MLKLKMDVLEALKENGVTSYTIKKGKPMENIVHQATLNKLRKWYTGEETPDLNTSTIDRICTILKCQPGDILEWVPEAEEE